MSDDALLLKANFIYRGVIQNPRAEAGAYTDDAGVSDLTSMTIRRTRLFWGSTRAPQSVSISNEAYYYAQCARGNLHASVQLGGREAGWPQIREGLGVTVIGQIGDEAARLFILVDGAPGTVETLRRFERNLRNLER